MLKSEIMKNSSVIKVIRETEYKCPLCGSNLRFFDWGVGCSNYRQGCRFSLFRKIAGKEIPDEQLIKIIETGWSDYLGGFKKKNSNTTFKCCLVYDKEKQGIRFSFYRSKEAEQRAEEKAKKKRG